MSLYAGETAHGQQAPNLIITVVDSGARFPLANADVIDLVTGQHRFTDEKGQARFPWPSNGQLRLRVRQVGYRPAERTLAQVDAFNEAATFALNKVAYVISPVTSTSRCSNAADSASLDLSFVELDQLRQAGSKFEQFARLYPFEMTVERRTARIPEKGSVKRILSEKIKVRSEKLGDAYKPGDIVQYQSGSFTVPILYLSTLGDSVFWHHHCFVARGIESYQGARVVRLEFAPTTDVKGPDYEGEALLDSTTSYLLRIDFRVSNLVDFWISGALPGSIPKRLDGYITFMSPSPFVVVPDTVAVIMWFQRPEGDDWGNPDIAQRIQLQELKFRKETPPGFDKAKRKEP